MLPLSRRPLLLCEDAAFLYDGRAIFPHTSLSLVTGDCLIVRGANAADRRLFLRSLTGKLPLLAGRRELSVARSETVSIGGGQALHRIPEEIPLQARWNSLYRSLSSSVGCFLAAEASLPASAPVFDCLGIAALRERRVLTLSKGEAQRVRLARGLSRSPRLLVIDEPFAGLDEQYRRRVADLLREMLGSAALVLGNAEAEGIGCETERCMWVEDTHLAVRSAEVPRLDPPRPRSRPRRPAPPGRPAGPAVLLELRHVSLEYSGVQVLYDVTWRVHRGERWAVRGPNGAGKSALLSLIAGDNPQFYMADIQLAGMRPGAPGSTIWDWKKHIGYAAPELLPHVAAGDPGFGRLDRVEKILQLVARAAVGRPHLLVFDELEEGLTSAQYMRVLDAIDAAARAGDGTLLMATHAGEALPRCISHELLLEQGGIIAAGERIYSE